MRSRDVVVVVPSDGARNVGPTCTSSGMPWSGARSATCTCGWCRAIATSTGACAIVFWHLGRKDALKASGQLEQLVGSFARLDPPLVGVRREVGPLLLAAHFIARARSDRHGRSRRCRAARASAAVGRARSCAALIASRLCSPSPLYDVAGWASGAALHELLGIPPALLNDDRLGRALEAFAVHAEPVRGALAARAIERFGFDAGPPACRSDHAPGRRRLRALGAGRQGLGPGPPRRAPGPRAAGQHARRRLALSAPRPRQRRRAALVGASLERLLRALRAGRLLIVCDSALRAAQDARADRPRRACASSCRCSASHGLPRALPAPTSATARCGRSRYVAERQRDLPAAQRTRYRGALRDWQLSDPETGEPLALRVAYIHSSEEAREVAAARERALAKAEDALARVQRGLGGRHYKTRRQVDARVGQILTGQHRRPDQRHDRHPRRHARH